MVTERQYETEAFESAEKKFDLMGTLTDDEGNPISEVDLAIKCEEDGTQYSATTDSDGKFLLENVGPGKYTVTVDSDDYDRTSEEHQVGEGSGDDTSSGGDEDGSDATRASEESEPEQSSDESSEDSEAEDSNGGGGDDSGNDDADTSGATEATSADDSD